MLNKSEKKDFIQYFSFNILVLKNCLVNAQLSSIIKTKDYHVAKSSKFRKAQFIY